MSESVCCVCGSDAWVRGQPGDEAKGTDAQRWCMPCDPTAPQTMTRDEALDRREVKFWTGRPCKRDHLSSRYASSGECIACVAIRVKIQRVTGVRRGYDIKYGRSNPGRLAATSTFFESVLAVRRAAKAAGMTEKAYRKTLQP